MNGYGDGRFAPNDNLSRAQLCQILYNKDGQPAAAGARAFPDVADGAWYAAVGEIALIQRMVGMLRQAGMVYLLHLRVLCQILNDLFRILRMTLQPQRQRLHPPAAARTR